MGFSEVSNILWRERQLLELLLFKLEEEQLVLGSGRSRWLSHATREVEMVIAEVQEAELARAIEVDALAVQLHLMPNASLRELAEAAPAPWDRMLEEHRKAFLTASQDIMALAQQNKELLSQGHKATREVLAWLGDNNEVDTYSASGATASSFQSPRLVNEAI